MDIDNQPIRIRVNNFNYEHFKSLGYDVPLNTYINIAAKELPYGAGTKIKVQCNYCGKIFEKPYRRYLETKDDVCCSECKTYKMIKSSLLKYGNKCSLRNPEVERKMIENNNKNSDVIFRYRTREYGIKPMILMFRIILVKKFLLAKIKIKFPNCTEQN